MEEEREVFGVFDVRVRFEAFRSLSVNLSGLCSLVYASVTFRGFTGPVLSLLAARTPEEDLSSFLAYFWLLNLAVSVLGVHNVRNCVVNSWERSIEGKGLAVIN